MKHLTEANVQISYLSEEFSVKSDESRKQKEEITHLLAQVIRGIQIRCPHQRVEGDHEKAGKCEFYSIDQFQKQIREEGVKKAQNFAYIFNGCSLTANIISFNSHCTRT